MRSPGPPRLAIDVTLNANRLIAIGSNGGTIVNGGTSTSTLSLEGAIAGAAVGSVTQGPLTICITVFGEVPATQALLVEGSGLQALDENNLRVDLTLRNQAMLPAKWPQLQIDLLDSQGLLLASKLLGPEDYQLRDNGSASDAALISGQKTVEVLAYLNLSELNNQMPESAATGFRLALYDHP